MAGEHDRLPAHAGGAERGRRRLPTLDEALPFSPFTSILPFSSELIVDSKDTVPSLDALPASDSPPILSSNERAASNSIFNTLNSHALRPEVPSPLLHQVLGDLRLLLDPQDLIPYKFTLPPNAGRASTSAREAATVANSQPSSEAPPTRLGSFANMALDVTEVDRRASVHVATPSIKTQESAVSNEAVQASPAATQLATAQLQTPRPTPSRPNPGLPPQNIAPTPTAGITQHPIVVIPSPAQSSVLRPEQVIEHSAPQSHIAYNPDAAQLQNFQNYTNNVSQPMVLVPNLPPSSDPSQYQSHPDLDAAIIHEEDKVSKKRKREDEDYLPKSIAGHRDQADAAVQSFKEMLIDIFDAEDDLKSNATDSLADQNHKYFIPSDESSSETAFALGPAAISTLETSLTKLISLKRFSDIPVEQLAHLQRLGLSSLSAANEVDVSVPDDNDDSVEQWARRVDLAENSLRASRFLLKIVTASMNEKQLSSEELIKDIISNLKHILESCIIPLVEKRNNSEESQFFNNRSQHRALMVSLMQRAGRVMKLCGDLVHLGELSESSVTTIEFLATKIVFTENAPTDKESILGLQKFEILRRHAMDVVAKVFLRYPEQRDFLLNEVLSSLEKLPVTRQSARQYKIAEGKPIQLVSALIMQLVQTSTMRDVTLSDPTILKESSVDSDESDAEDSSARTTPQRGSRRRAISGVPNQQLDGPFASLEDVSSPRLKSAKKNAETICHYLVHRALNTTKTGDQPYRNLLDIFTEDFLNVLGFAEWPAAELLLRVLLAHFLRIAGDEKSTAPAKNMALDLMGTIGSGIADLRSYTSRASRTAASTSDNLIGDISQVCEDMLSGTEPLVQILRKEGPYRIIIEYLQGDDLDSLQIQSAIYFSMMQWAHQVYTTVANDAKASVSRDESPGDHNSTIAQSEPLANVARWLTNLISDYERNKDDRIFRNVNPTEVRLYNSLVLLNTQLFRAFDLIFSVLLRALSSQQATVRSRGIKSVSQLLEKDATILDRAHHVMAHIVHATTDASPLVRDSALTLIGKCMALKPALESEACKALIGMSVDPGTSVRKRALKLLRDLYLRNKSKDLRAAVADAILRRLDDIEESIVELARQSLEDIWLTPFHGLSTESGSTSAQAKQDLEEHAALIVATVSRGDGIGAVLENLFKQAFVESEKNAKANQEVCRAIVRLLFDNIIDNEDGEGRPSRTASLQALTIFAKSDPHLFDGEQMVTLRPYIDNISFGSDDILVYRSIVMIYRRVLPVLPPLQKGFLLGVQDVLLNNIAKLGKHELNEATACLWIIDEVLQNTERLARVTVSVLVKIESAKKGNLNEQKEVVTLKRLIMLAGYFGKACDFQSQVKFFKERFPTWKGSSVSDLIVGVLIPLAGNSSPSGIRESALDSICLVCQAWPMNFLNTQVSGTFRSVFEENDSKLVFAVLSGFRSFYLLEDERAKSGSSESADQSTANGNNKLGKSMTVTHNDGASTSIAQQFLPDILRIALSSQGEVALLATDIITSTNRQGLVHPKECGRALVALETSPDPMVAKAAMEEHRSLHSKHESMMDKEYVNAVEEAFVYQRNTVGNPLGVDAGMNPKLRPFYEVLKTGSVALRKKLLTNLCVRVNVDPNKSLAAKDVESRLQYARFVMENLSLFEYGRIDELLHLISHIEKMFTASGNAVSQRIETMLNVQMGNGVNHSQHDMSLPEQNGNISMANGVVDPHELQSLTMAAMILSMLWQTRLYLRRAWSLQSLRSGKAKAAAKDVNKPPLRAANVSAEEHIDKIAQIMTSMQSSESMKDRCRAFVELLAVDLEAKVGSDEEADGAVRFGTPSDDGGIATPGENGSMGPPSGGSKRGRRTPSSIASTPKGPSMKRGRPSLGMPRTFGSRMSLGEDDELGWD